MKNKSHDLDGSKAVMVPNMKNCINYVTSAAARAQCARGASLLRVATARLQDDARLDVGACATITSRAPPTVT